MAHPNARTTRDARASAEPSSGLNLNRLAYFAAVVETGSFTRAAERLGITKAVVSQQITKLEREVGCTLLARTTRSVRPTDAGRALHGRCVVILREAAEGFDELARDAVSPQGTLRVTASVDYGTSVVVPTVLELLRLYPACNVVLTLRDDKVALDGVDVAIRVGWLTDSNERARKVGVFRQLLVAAPSLARHLAPLREPADLLELPFVAHGALTDALVWRFTSDAGAIRTVHFQARLTVDATPALRAAVLAGAGLAVLPDYLVEDDLAAGRLCPVLPGWSLRGGGIHAVFPVPRLRPARVNAFVDLLVQCEKTRRKRGTEAMPAVSR